MPEVTRIQRKDFISDLDEIAREGARRMLAVALEAEAADYIARHQDRDEHGRAQVVRNGKARQRKVTLGSGTIEVRAPRIDDRRHGEEGRRHRFHSQILPPYMRRSPKVAEVLPILYLRGLTLSPRSGHPFGASTLRMGGQGGEATSKEVYGRVQGRDGQVDPRKWSNGRVGGARARLDGDRGSQLGETGRSLRFSGDAEPG